ncbi:hypothetical protein [Cyclobacterium plantarum]|uniref:hypothetical protein n=1 Tax=Cyclobacterium plantarum TaxID=2716263 RepID=UPI003F723722
MLSSKQQNSKVLRHYKTKVPVTGLLIYFFKKTTASTPVSKEQSLPQSADIPLSCTGNLSTKHPLFVDYFFDSSIVEERQ